MATWGISVCSLTHQRVLSFSSVPSLGLITDCLICIIFRVAVYCKEMQPSVNCYDSDLATWGLQMELNWLEEVISINCETYLMSLSGLSQYHLEG